VNARRYFMAVILGTLIASRIVSATTVRDVQQRVGLDQHLGSAVPASLKFLDERGRSVPLGDFLGSRPVILALVYYTCPNLCSLTLTSLTRSLRTLDLQAGRDFEVIAVSIDPRETPVLATTKRAAYLSEYTRDAAVCRGCEAGWHFLTGPAASSSALAASVGFHYFYDPAQQQYAHPSGIVVLTPRGRISQYFNGIEFPAPALRQALLQARAERSGSLAERLWLLCFHYDALAGPYSARVTAGLRILGALVVLALGGFVARLIATSP
jgi:protein SCO1